jgi:hypothetical protein
MSTAHGPWDSGVVCQSTVDREAVLAACSLELILEGDSWHGNLTQKHLEGVGGAGILTVATDGGGAAWFGRATTMNVGGGMSFDVRAAGA